MQRKPKSPRQSTTLGELDMLTLGSLFDGIGGFPLAAVHNDIVPLWASEIEKFPIEVTKVRFPEMEHFGDITKLKGSELPPVDIITGGSPCQDLSIASGTRKGLQGERSGLFMDQMRIVREMREADAKRKGITRGTGANEFLRPRFMVWENVPGAFSSAEGEDFRAVIEEIVRVDYPEYSVPRPDTGKWESAGAVILGDEFSLAWSVLDAQGFGVPQRRRRIYLVADFAGASASEILFKQESLCWDSEESQGEGQNPPSPVRTSTNHPSRGRIRSFHVNQRQKVNCGEATREAPLGGEVIETPEITGALLASQNQQMQTFITEEPLYCVSDQGGQRMDIYDNMVGTLKASMAGNVPMVLGSTKPNAEICENISPTLTASSGTGGGNAPLLLTPQTEELLLLFENHRRDCRYEGPLQVVPTLMRHLGTGGNNSPLLLRKTTAYSLDSKESNSMKSPNPFSGCRETEVARTLDTSNPDPSKNQGGIAILEEPQSFCIVGNIINRKLENGGNGMGCLAELAYTLTSGDCHAVLPYQEVVGALMARDQKGVNDRYVEANKCVIDGNYQSVVGALCRGDEKGVNNQYVSQDKCVIDEQPPTSTKLIRRLTPLECERLQGFPDYWTEIPKCSDSARYKALGNSVAVPCVDFVLWGVAQVLRRMYAEQNAVEHEEIKEETKE